MSDRPKITPAYRSTTSMELDRCTHEKLKELQKETKLPMYRLGSLVLEHGLEPFRKNYAKFMKQQEGGTDTEETQ